jgi:hypothetical protein
VIALLTAPALAASALDVSIALPIVEGELARFYDEPLASLGYVTPEPAAPKTRFSGGFTVVGEGWGDANGGLLLLFGADLWSRSWEHVPTDFGVAVWSTQLGAGWRVHSGPLGGAPVAGYADAVLGATGQFVLPTWYKGVVSVTPSLDLGMGVTIGRGPVRGHLGGRAGVCLGNAETSGSVTNTPDDFAWEWSSGRGWIRLQAGVSFILPRRARPDEVPAIPG